jgi:hypothetical protein
MIKTKVIIGETQLSKTFKELVFKDLPINKWCEEQKIKRQKIKL